MGSHAIDDIVLVWFDPNISETDKNIQDSLNQLRPIIHTIKIFNNEDECTDFFAHVKNETIFIIVSGSAGEKFVPHIETITQIDSIYVFCLNKSKHQSWAKNCPKVKGIYTQIGYIYEALKRDIENCVRILGPIHIIASPSTTDSNELDQSFMYSHLLKEILLEMEYDNKAKKDFIDFCRNQYADNKPMLQLVDEFKHKYDRPSPIWWYTRTCFVYSVLNKALRIRDLETILMMGFIVRDLHRQIEKLHSKSRNKDLIIVYRGQGMSPIEFNKIKDNQGGLVSFHSFLSTSIDRQISLAYAESARTDPDLIGILFQMKIDPSIPLAPFVSLDDISYYASKEKEYLFSMNTIFRIGEIKNLDDRLWEVHLTLTSNNDEQLQRLIQHMRQAIEGKTALQRLGNLLFKMDEFDKAEKMFQQLLTLASDNDWEQSLYAHYQLGYINNSRNDLSAAYFHYKQSAEIALAHRPSTDGQLFGSYSNIGVILHKQGDLDSAIQYFQLAIDLERQAEKPNQLAIATRQTNVGVVHQQQGRFTEAIKNFERALGIQLTHLPPRHPSLGETYKNMASVQYSLKDYTTALSYYDKVLQIQQRSLRPNDPSLAETHNCMATILEDLNMYKEAIEHVLKAINIAREASGPNRSQIQNYEQYHEHLKKLQLTLNPTDDNKELFS